MLAMTLSGGLAGLGGSFEVLGTVRPDVQRHQRGLRLQRDRPRPAGRATGPRGIVAAALLFGALRTGGGLMQVKTGIPLDLLFFIQALVIMFVAAPGLDPRPVPVSTDAHARARRRRLDEGSAGMTAASPTIEQRRPRGRAPPSARRCGPRGSAAAIIAALGLSRFAAAIGTMDIAADVLVLDRQAGRRARSRSRRPSASCGSWPAS